MAIRYIYRRRAHPELFITPDRPTPSRRKKRKPRLMTQEEVDEQFPIMTYKEAGHVVDSSDSVNGDKKRTSIEMTEMVGTDFENVERNTSGGNSTTLEKDSAAKVYEASPDVESQHHETIPHEGITENSEVEYDHDDGDDEEGEVSFDEVADNTCIICIDALEDTQPVRRLKCGHIFHAECIDPWLTLRRANCPLCKRDYYIPKDEIEVKPAEATQEPRQSLQQQQQQQQPQQSDEHVSPSNSSGYVASRLSAFRNFIF